MSLQAKLIGFGICFLLAVGVYFKVESIFNTLKKQSEEISTLNEQKTELEAINGRLNETIGRVMQEQKDKDAINKRLNEQQTASDGEFQVLKQELEDLKRNRPDKAAPKITPVIEDKSAPSTPDTLEVDIAWRAYCKALPSGCSEVLQ